VNEILKMFTAREMEKVNVAIGLLLHCNMAYVIIFSSNTQFPCCPLVVVFQMVTVHIA
jgi:hypothetical protein